MFKINAHFQGILVAIIAYIILDNAFPPLMPKTLLIQYMAIIIVGILLYFSYNQKRWDEFKAPVIAVMRNDNTIIIRWFFLVSISGLAGYVVYDSVKPSLDSPVELRQVHPAPPSKIKVFNNTYDLTKLENPVMAEVISKYSSDKESAMEIYSEAVESGRKVYFENCFYCHGDILDGNGPYAKGFNPKPINFQDVGTIAQLQEAFLFWRITTGGPGLPIEGTPWNSAMPVWHEILDESQVWNTITFLYDYVGQVPRIWDTKKSKIATEIKDNRVEEFKSQKGNSLYQHRCAACHGEQGMGDGSAAEYLYPKPRDFSLGMFKFTSSPSGSLARDEDLINTIKYGLAGTGMPGWETVLTDSQIQSLVPIIKGFDTVATWAPEEAEDEDFDDDGRYIKFDYIQESLVEPKDGQVMYSEESISKGKGVFEETCTECHGDAGRGNIMSGKKLEDDWGNRIWPRDLTKPWLFRGTNIGALESEDERANAIANIYQRLSIGIPGTPMPAHREVEEGNKDPVSLEDRWHIANYVYSLGNSSQAPSESGVINASKYNGDLPTDINDIAWNNVESTTLQLVPNIIQGERLFTPLNDAISVRALYNESDIVFMLQINDRTDSRPGEETSEGIQDEDIKMYSDAFAVQLPKKGSYKTSPTILKPLYRHGDEDNPTTIWYWSAGSISPEKPPSSILMDGTGPNEKLVMRNSSSFIATGAWKDGLWTVIMKRPRINKDDDIDFNEGNFIPISFANWDGSNGESRSKHTLTSWYWLILPPELDIYKVYVLPFSMALLVFVMGLVTIRSQRSKK